MSNNVETVEMQNKLLELCETGCLGESTAAIVIRIRETDLVAAEARYHHKCYLQLLNAANASVRSKSGVYDTLNENFLRLCDWPENECELTFILYQTCIRRWRNWVQVKFMQKST